MVGPLLALAYILYIIDGNSGYLFKLRKSSNSKIGVRFGKTCAAVGIAVTLIILSALPFALASKDYPWYQLLIDKYFGTATSYKFATINAYNIYALFGLNWAKITNAAGGLNIYGQLGVAGMVFSIVAGTVLYFFGRLKNKGALYLSGAFTLLSIFMFGHYMHERYMFPALLMLMIAYIHYSDRRLLGIFFGFTVTSLINCIAAFYYSEEAYFNAGLYWDNSLITACSVWNLILFVFFTYVCVQLMLCKGRTKDVFFRGRKEYSEENHSFDPDLVFMTEAGAEKLKAQADPVKISSAGTRSKKD